ncbi:MAG: hypothetical protein R2792_15020 [Saprospiraceae bacterium]
MMRTKPIFLTLLFFASALFYLPAQVGPCLSLPGDANSCPQVPDTIAVLGSPTVLMRVFDEPSELQEVEFARYKAAWIYGDGNFDFPSDGTYEQDLATFQRSYTYHGVGRYDPFVIFTEKKSNSEPPAYARRGLNIQPTGGAAAAAPSPFVKRLENNMQSADVFESAPMRPKYPTAFSVSTSRTDQLIGIYFFYNSKRDSGATRFTADELHVVDTLLLPNYLASSQVVFGSTLDTTPEIKAIGFMREIISSQYRNYILVVIPPDGLSSMPADFDEIRIFPVLKTIWEKNSLPLTQFMTLVIGGTTPGLKGSFNSSKPAGVVSDSTFYTEERLDSLLSEVRASFPGLDLGSDLLIPGSNGYYLRGLHTQTVDMVGSIDPNELTVLSICPSGLLYDVEMEMQVCNKGYLDEYNIQIELTDLIGSMQDLVFEDSSLITNFVYNPGAKSWTFNWGENWGGVPNPYLDEASYSPQCHAMKLHVKTNWAGVQALSQGEGLEFCVTFNNAVGDQVECNNNFSLDDAFVLPGVGYKCGDPDGDCRALYLVLFILLLLFLYDWFNWKKLKPNPDAC